MWGRPFIRCAWSSGRSFELWKTTAEKLSVGGQRLCSQSPAPNASHPLVPRFIFATGVTPRGSISPAGMCTIPPTRPSLKRQLASSHLMGTLWASAERDYQHQPTPSQTPKEISECGRFEAKFTAGLTARHDVPTTILACSSPSSRVRVHSYGRHPSGSNMIQTSENEECVAATVPPYGIISSDSWPSVLDACRSGG